MNRKYVHVKGLEEQKYLFVMLYYDFNPNNTKISIENIAEKNINVVESLLGKNYAVVGIFNHFSWTRMLNMDKRMIKIVNNDEKWTNDARNIALGLNAYDANNVIVSYGYNELNKLNLSFNKDSYVLRVDKHKNNDFGLIRDGMTLRSVVPSGQRDWNGFAYYNNIGTKYLKKICFDQDKNNLMQPEIINEAIIKDIPFKVKQCSLYSK